MNKKSFTAAILIFFILALFTVSGRFLVLGGAVAFALWTLPLAVLSVGVKNDLIFKKLAVLFAVIYILLSVFFLKGDDLYGRKKLSEWQEGDTYCKTFELNPGAAGHLVYEERVFHTLIDSDLLTVRVLQKTERYSSDDGLPSER